MEFFSPFMTNPVTKNQIRFWFIHKLDGRWSCMSRGFLINFGFM